MSLSVQLQLQITLIKTWWLSGSLREESLCNYGSLIRSVNILRLDPPHISVQCTAHCSQHSFASQIKRKESQKQILEFSTLLKPYSAYYHISIYPLLICDAECKTLNPPASQLFLPEMNELALIIETLPLYWMLVEYQKMINEYQDSNLADLLTMPWWFLVDSFGSQNWRNGKSCLLSYSCVCILLKQIVLSQL